MLGISSDSAYRRMRGEKTISLEELQILCTHYKVSIDHLMGLQSGGIVFQGQYLDKNNFRFEEYAGVNVHGIMSANVFSKYITRIN